MSNANMIAAFVNPFGYAYAKGAIGNITTRNYVYYVSKGNKLSYLESPHQVELCKAFQLSNTLPANLVNTNEALRLATQWLAAISIDVAALNRDCSVKVDLDDTYVRHPVGKFVPVYFVSWLKSRSGSRGSTASVRLFTPTQTLLQLRVEDPRYILRSPIVFTNLTELLSQTNVFETTNPPSSR